MKINIKKLKIWLFYYKNIKKLIILTNKKIIINILFLIKILIKVN